MLEHALFEIEKDIKGKLNAESLAKAVSMSSAHLQRLFRLAFERSLANYIRSRKLAASLEVLLKTDFKVIDIAGEYGFEYEQSYIRAFKREFGVTPGEARSAGDIIEVTPPLRLIDKNKFDEDLFFGPSIVMVPEFYMVGRPHILPRRRSEDAPQVGKQFWRGDREKILHKSNEDVYIGLTRIIDGKNCYMPSVPVKKIEDVHQELEYYTFKAALCARFRYVGQHRPYDISPKLIKKMYEAVDAYRVDENAGYHLMSELSFEKIDAAYFDGVFCQMEWFTPVTPKVD
ncbi:MAG: helix-turn-helix domain-containing protein [Defluviitaleaceae bacterium]|nr:helix-turn-helix domain-containing protein [Defluviitaleaceae bacterium]